MLHYDRPGIHAVEVPDIRQRDHYSCGACASMCVGKYFRVGPPTIAGWKRILGTTLAHSTDPRRIVEVMRGFGLFVEASNHLQVKNLQYYTANNMPVIVCVQDYGNRRQEGAAFAYGHYLTAIGVALGYVLCQDSSEENVLTKDNESIQAPGRVLIAESDFNNVWHDKALDGTRFVHYGIAIGRK